MHHESELFMYGFDNKLYRALAWKSKFLLANGLYFVFFLLKSL